MLDSTMPYYQSGLRNRLSYGLTFNGYDRVIIIPDSPPNQTLNMRLRIEHSIVTQPDLAKLIALEYQSMVLSYDRILRKRKIVNKSDMEWSWSLDTLCKSFKGILVLFKLEKPYERDTSRRQL